MERTPQIEHITKNVSGLSRFLTFDKQKIVEAVLNALGTSKVYAVPNLSHKLNIKQSDLINILTHARINIIDNYVTEEGIQYLVDREVGKIKRYFEQSLANYSSLSAKEQLTFNAFIKRYGIKYRKIKKWDDLRIEAIRRDCHDELTGYKCQTFHDGKYICYTEIERSEEPRSRYIIHMIRSSLMYNIKNMRKWIRFKPILDIILAYILMHHFHIFTSDDNNSIHKAEQISMFNLPQNAKNYILAA